MSHEAGPILLLLLGLLPAGGCGNRDPNEFCSDGQYGPRDVLANLSAGELREIDRFGPAAGVYSDPRDHETLVVVTHCEAGDCSAAYLELDGRRIGVPDRGEFSLGYQYDPHVLWAANRGGAAATVRVTLSGSYHHCYI